MARADRVRATTFTTPSDREIVMTCVVAAPRPLVFEAWTKPEHVPHWLLGPSGWTMPVCEIDLRPGGAWHFVWRRSDGTEMGMRGVYREIAPPERLVSTESWGGDWPETLNKLTLTEENGKTTITNTILYPSKEARDAALETGMRDGVSESFDRLAEYLAGATNMADREIVTTRVVDAPRERVFEAWIDPKQVAQWWGPNGFTNTIHEMDVRPGGVWRFVMHGPDGIDYKNKIVFDEMVKPERLVYSHVSGPMFHVTATFDEEGGKTKLTMRMLFETAAERDQAVKVFGAVEGAKQTLGRLEEHVAKTG
jgi:uncharacterized protein YndB with AHSA1/START domain